MRPSPLFVGFCLVLGCAPAPEPLPNASGRHAVTLDEVRALDAEDIDIGRAALLLAREVDPELDLASLDGQLDDLAREVRQHLSSETSLEDRVRILVTILAGRGDTYVEDQNRLDVLLAESTGNCVAFSTLYLAVGQRAGLEMRTRTAPSHQYVHVIHGDAGMDIEATAHLGLPDGVAAGHFFFTEDQRRRHDVLLDARQWLSTYWSETVLARHRVGERDDALARLDEALAIWPGNRGARIQKLTVLRGSDPSAAALEARAVVGRDPDDADAWAFLGECELEAGDVASARTAVDRALGLDDRYPRIWLLAAHVALAEGSAEATIACLERAERVPLSQLHTVRRTQHTGALREEGFAIVLHDTRLRAHTARAEELTMDGYAKGHSPESIDAITFHTRAAGLHLLALFALRGDAQGARNYLSRAQAFDGLPASLESLAEKVRTMIPPEFRK